MTVTITFEDDEIAAIQNNWSFAAYPTAGPNSRAYYKIVNAIKPKFIPKAGDRILAYETSAFGRHLMSVEEGEIVIGVTERNVFTSWLGDDHNESLGSIEHYRYEISTHEFEVVQ